MSTILVTGAAGFIGSHLVDRLLADGHQVHAVDSFDDFYDPGIKRRNLRHASHTKQFTLHEVDIRDEAGLRCVWRKEPYDAVMHLAARAGVGPSLESPRLYHDVNVNGTINVLERCRERPPASIIFASSSSVYGNQKKIPFSETDRVDQPISPYAASKRAGELLCHVYHQLYGLNITCLRLFTVYGPRIRPDLAVARFTRLIDQGRPVQLFGDGNAVRDFTFIDDAIDGIVAAMNRPNGYKIFNISGGTSIRIADLVDRIEAILGATAKRTYSDPKPGDAVRTIADIRRARAELGYEPKIDVNAGLAQFVEWYRTVG